MLICRFCGSDSLVWDDRLGFIVCSTCGSILEGIMDDFRVDQGALIPKRAPLPRRDRWVIVDRLNAISSPVNSRALNVISRYEVVRLTLKLVDSNPVLKARTTRGRVALALYALYRAIGYSKVKSRVLASRAIRVSPRVLEVTTRKHRGYIEDLEAKARELVERLARQGKLEIPLP